MTVDAASSLDALAASAQALERSISDLTDGQARQDSLLPGWTRGHVLTHVARNADAMRNLAEWARTGVMTPMYPSRGKRDADIAAGADRPVADLRADVHDTQQQLMDDLRSLTDDQWNSTIRIGKDNHEAPATVIPGMRRIEVEVHHVDLDLDYTLAHWPEDFVETMLTDTTKDFNARADVPSFVLVGNDNEGSWTVGAGGPEITGTPPSLLGWLLGRTDGIGLHSDESLPTLEAWK